MASLGFIQGWGGRVPDVEPHEEFADVGSGFQEGLVVDEQARARSASFESELVRFGEADKFREGDLGSTRSVISISAGGWHVESSRKGLCGLIARVEATQGIIDGGGWRGEGVKGLLDGGHVGKVLPK